jgi:aminoglycoside phosphotransferase (APT) family kinase protein
LIQHLLESTFRELSASGTRVTVGRSTRIGRGLSRLQSAAHVELDPDPEDLSGTYVVGLPYSGSDAGFDARAAAEKAIVERLSMLDLPFRIPRMIRQVHTPRGTATIREFVRGVELDLRAGRQASVRPWLVVGEIAAALHRVPTEGLHGRLPGSADRADFSSREIESLAMGRDHPDVARAIDWATSRRLSSGPATVIHGDLLGQNILLDPEQRPTVIDWEYCRLGDPAYDLAIITRGARRPFQVSGGLEQLLDAYRGAGGDAISPSAVHFYEVCITAGWVRDAMRSRDQALVAHAAIPLQSLLRRVMP